MNQTHPVTPSPRHLVSPSRVPLYPPRNGKPRDIEIAPGKLTADLPPSEVSRICVADLIPQGDHTYRAVARVHSTEIRLTHAMLEKLNLGVRLATMRRLIKGGFVDGARIAPNCYTFRLQSYYDFRESVRQAAEEGRDFWTGDNLARYRAAI